MTDFFCAELAVNYSLHSNTLIRENREGTLSLPWSL